MGRRRGREQKRGAPAERRGRWNWRLLLFLAGVFVVKAIVLAQLQHHPLLEPEGGVDSAEYAALARRVLNGDLLLGPGLYYLSPLYVYFLAAILAISDSFTVVRVVQIALGTAGVWCIFAAARTWFGTRAAWIAAALAALTGVFTFYEIVIFQSSIDVFLTSAALACLAGGLVGDSPAVADGVAGVFFGLAFMNRPNMAIAIAGIVLTLLLVRRWRAAVWISAGVALAVAPLAVRNAIVTHDLALTSSQGGLNFYIGNNAAATGQYVAVPGVRANMAGQAEDTRKVAEAAAGRTLTDAEVSSYFAGQAFGWIREHPATALKFFARKLALVFNARHQWLDYSYPYYAYDAGSILAWLFVGPWLLVPLGLAGLAAGLRPPSPLRGVGETGAIPDTGPYAAWLVFVPAYAISVALFFVAERYRLPLFVPLCILSGAAIDQLLHALRKPFSVLGPLTSATAGLGIALGVAGAMVTAWPFHLEDGRYDERLRLAKVLMNDHDYGAAAMELERAYAIRPEDTTTEFNLGMAFVSNGRIPEGLVHVRHAVDAGVPIHGARYALANAMLMTGDRDGAVALLRTYAPAPEDDAESCLRVAQLAMNAGAPVVADRYLQRALQLKPGWPEALQALQQIR
jgi:4-amino-4-deoxy-L-arabinose transferase-like glycosyltransferase